MSIFSCQQQASSVMLACQWQAVHGTRAVRAYQLAAAAAAASLTKVTATRASSRIAAVFIVPVEGMTKRGGECVRWRMWFVACNKGKVPFEKGNMQHRICRHPVSLAGHYAESRACEGLTFSAVTIMNDNAYDALLVLFRGRLLLLKKAMHTRLANCPGFACRSALILLSSAVHVQERPALLFLSSAATGSRLLQHPSTLSDPVVRTIYTVRPCRAQHSPSNC